jgi:hypothetical protein
VLCVGLEHFCRVADFGNDINVKRTALDAHLAFDALGRFDREGGTQLPIELP